MRAETAAALLRIDERRTLDALTASVQGSAAESGARSALLGLSGGLDSSVLAAVAVRALGSDRVRLINLFDQTSAQALRTNARTVADWLGVPLEELSIEAEMRKASVYSSGAAGLTALSGGLNRLLYRIYRVATGEPPFVLSLRAGDVAVPSLEAASREEARADVRRTGGLHRTLVLDAAAGFVARHRYRREVLEAEAKVADCFLLGAANRSEWLTGWFVKGGIDDLPMQPLRGLYKTQVRQLAVALDIPGSVRRAPPSPDMMRGITDELALGMPYPTIDLALDVLAGGVTFQQAAEAGVTARDLRRVQQLVRLSAWKRMPPPGPPAEPSESQSREARVPQPGPPADGGPSGGCD